MADGNVSRKLEIPLYMIFPIYFSCPNFISNGFTVDFEVNFIMILFDGFKITLNFPLTILRWKNIYYKYLLNVNLYT